MTRVDACADFDAPGAFEALLAPCIEIKKEHKLRGEKAGDWEDFPSSGEPCISVPQLLRSKLDVREGKAARIPALGETGLVSA